jgi:hypothetical protein
MLVDTFQEILLDFNIKVKPVKSFLNPDGKYTHIWIQDTCYVIGKEIEGFIAIKDNHPIIGLIVRPTGYILPEILEELKKLPSLGEI